MLITPWFIVAVACSFAGYLVYLLGIRRELVRPNRASWMIWSTATTVEAVTYAAVNPGAPQGWIFLIAALSCLTITIAIWRRSAWSAPTLSEGLCMAACLVSLLLWLAFKEAFWAHMLVVAMVPVSFWPTWESVQQDRARERSPAWGLWTIGDLATVLVAARAEQFSAGGFAYIFVELACHASVWFMIGLLTINPLRSFGFRNGRFYILDRIAPAANLFAVGETHLGRAVFAAVAFREGERVYKFTGPMVRADRLPADLNGARDHYVQVTSDRYLGPSGRIDDLINHGCTPNAGLRFTDHGVVLIAIRDIEPGEEITWDYSTTLADSNWHMICQCRSPECRRVIGNFATLSAEKQAWYRARNLVAPYLRDAGTQRDAAGKPASAQANIV